MRLRQVFSQLASLGRNLFVRGRVEQELDAELRSYLDMVADGKHALGTQASEARRAALIELGGLEQVKEEVREVRNGRPLEELGQDVRYGFRTLRKNPSFTVAACLALALGIGACTLIFSVAYGMLMRPLPYPEAARVAVVYMRYFPRDFAYGTLCVRDYLTWKENNHAFEDPSLYRNLRMDIGGDAVAPEQVQGATVTTGFFPALGVRPRLGRLFATGEDQPAGHSLAVLSEGLWRRRYAASSAVLGQTILVNGAPATVIGVIGGAVRFPRRDTEVWTNLVLNPPTRYGPWLYRGVARLKPGVTFTQAETELNNIALLIMRQNPDYRRLRLPMLSLRDALLGSSVKPAILLLSAAVGLVLLIAVVNVANLLLARATVREREMALRLSLGALRARLVRQLLTESVLLALLGGLLGLAFAWGGVALLRAWNPGDLPLMDSVQIDGLAFGFAFLISLGTGCLFGIAPALEGMRADLNATLKEGGRTGSASRAHGRMRAALVVCEIAFSLMLLVGAGLLLRSFENLQQVSGGMSAPARQILTMLISPTDKKYRDDGAGLAYYQEILRRARPVPGVQAAALSESLPPDRQGDADTFGMEGQALAPGEINPIISDPTVGPDFFRVLGIPLLQGRFFNEHDTASSLPVTIVSEGFVRRFLPHQQVLGKRIRQSEPSVGMKWMEIVGVVGNVKYLGLAVDTDPAYYLPFAQNYGAHMFLVVRAAGDAARLEPGLRRTVQEIDPGVTLAQASSMEQALAESVSQPRFNSLLLALFAAIALLLAAVGIYGLIAYSVALRTREIGVRVALGAARSEVVKMVFWHSARLAASGILFGLGGALLLTRLLKSMLFEIGDTDPLTFAAAPLGMLLVVLLASALPAFRATRISPLVALRYE